MKPIPNTKSELPIKILVIGLNGLQDQNLVRELGLDLNYDNDSNLVIEDGITNQVVNYLLNRVDIELEITYSYKYNHVSINYATDKIHSASVLELDSNLTYLIEIGSGLSITSKCPFTVEDTSAVLKLAVVMMDEVVNTHPRNRLFE